MMAMMPHQDLYVLGLLSHLQLFAARYLHSQPEVLLEWNEVLLFVIRYCMSRKNDR